MTMKSRTARGQPRWSNTGGLRIQHDGSIRPYEALALASYAKGREVAVELCGSSVTPDEPSMSEMLLQSLRSAFLQR